MSKQQPQNMASNNAKMDTTNFSSCYICFEIFKSPRLLPCSHSFCEHCLCAHIVSTCEQRAFPLGFHCPLCREFVPSPGQPDETICWAGKFPINDALLKLLEESQNFNVCWPCRRENEEKEATSFCLTCKEPLCKMCLKFHKKSLASMNHEISLVSEIGWQNHFSHSSSTEGCEKHMKNQIVLFCSDHKVPCCAECFTKDHRMCASILTVEQAARNLQSLGKMESLKQELEKLTGKLMMARMTQEENNRKLSYATDIFTKEAQELQQEVLSHISNLFDEHFSKIKTKTKEAKRKLKSATLSFSDRIDFLDYLLKLLISANVSADSEENALNCILTFLKVKEKMALISEYPLGECRVTLISRVHDSIKQILTLTRVGTLSVTNSHS